LALSVEVKVFSCLGIEHKISIDPGRFLSKMFSVFAIDAAEDIWPGDLQLSYPGNGIFLIANRISGLSFGVVDRKWGTGNGGRPDLRDFPLIST
jgi:hypothetical protein